MAADLQDANSKAHLSALHIDERNLRDLDAPVRAEMVFEIPGHFSGDPDREGSVTDSKVWAKLLSLTLDYDRETALDLWSPFESRHRYVFHLPPGWRLDAPPRDHAARSKWGTFTLTVKEGDDPHELAVELHTRLEKARVEPEDFAEFRRFQEDVSKSYRVWLTLKPAVGLEDAAALEALLTLGPDDLASARALARLYTVNGQTDDANRVIGRALHYHPKDARLWELRVRAAGSLADEEAAYRAMTRRFPGDPKYAIALAAVLVDRGQLGEARKVLGPLATKGKTAVRGLALYHLARVALADGKAEQALKQVQAAEKADAQALATPEALQFQGELYEKLRKPKEAADAYRRLAESDGYLEQGLLALIRLEVASGARADALDHLRRYELAVEGDDAGMLTAADYYLRLGRLDEAFDLATRAGKPRFHEQAHRILGLIYRQRGQHAQAVVHLGKADPDAVVLEALIRSHLALGQLKEAVERADQGDRIEDAPAGLRQAVIMANSLAERRAEVLKAAKVPAGREEVWNNAAAKFVCAEYAWREDRPAAEVETLLATMPDGVTLGPAYGLRGLLALEHGRLSKALADAEKSVALSPAEELGYQVRGRVRLERGAEGALADLTKAVELSGHRDATALHWLAAARFRAGQVAEALAAQREAVKLRPKDRELTEQLKEFEGAGKGHVGG
jgi:tetratricopeptide (TPR) repeat protein